jgi:hypothetical protein
MNRLALLFLLILPQMLSAQAVDIRGFGGIMMNTKTDNPLFERYQSFSRLNAGGGIGASYRRGRLEFGIKLDYRRYSFVDKTVLRFADDFDPATGFTHSLKPPVETTIVRKEPAIAIAPVFNYHFGKSRLGWYAGLSPAFVRYTMVSPAHKDFKLSEGINGWSVDAQAGAAYEILPRLRAFAEISGGYVRMPYFTRKETSMWAAGMNLGMQFRVWEKAAGPAVAE